MELGQRLHTKMTVPPSVPLLTDDDAKGHAQVTSLVMDLQIREYIEIATDYTQDETWRQFLLATFQTKLDSFPDVFYLPHPPLSSVTSVAYTDVNGDAQTLTAGTDYQVDVHSEPGIIMPARGATWPTVLDGTLNAVTVTYIAGYGTASNVPRQAKQAVRFLVA